MKDDRLFLVIVLALVVLGVIALGMSRGEPVHAELETTAKSTKASVSTGNE